MASRWNWLGDRLSTAYTEYSGKRYKFYQRVHNAALESILTRGKNSVHTEDVGNEKVRLSEKKRCLCSYQRCLFQGDMVPSFSGKLFGTLTEKVDLRAAFFYRIIGRSGVADTE